MPSDFSGHAVLDGAMLLRKNTSKRSDQRKQTKGSSKLQKKMCMQPKTKYLKLLWELLEI